MNNYYNNGVEKVTTRLTYEEANELKEILANLDKAIEKGDKRAILEYESMLNEKGIFGETYQKINAGFKGRTIYSRLNTLFHSNSEGNISNSMCYFYATGTGMVIYTIGSLLLIPTVALISMFGEEILQILIPIYLAIMLLTHLVPFRICMPIATINMEDGTMSAIGLAGSQTVNVNDSSPSHQVTTGGFTGITVSIPNINENESELNGFMFISGFSILAKSKDS